MALHAQASRARLPLLQRAPETDVALAPRPQGRRPRLRCAPRRHAELWRGVAAVMLDERACDVARCGQK